jgi:hypothetical protein
MSEKETAAHRRLMKADLETMPDAELRRLLLSAGLAKKGETLSKSDLDSWRTVLEAGRDSDEFPFDDAFLAGAAVGLCGGINKKMVYTAASVKAYKDADPDADEDELIGYGIGLNL